MKLRKSNRKASDAAENLQLLYRVVRFFRPRSLCNNTL